MAHGFPSGYVRLYDESGNPVDVELRSDGKYALSVSDDRVRKLLEEILEELKEKT